MQSGPLVSVTIPSYNYEQYLAEAVESAATQRGVSVDVVIVDNASTDCSLALARRLAQEYDNVRVVEYAENHGIISSLNRCRDEVRGEYAVLLCADDCLTPGSLVRSVNFMELHPNVGMTYGPVLDFVERSDVRQAQIDVPSRPPKTFAGSEWIDRRCRGKWNPVRTPEVMMRSSVLDVAGKLEPACPHTSDLNMWLRIAAVSDVAFLPGPPLALFRQHGSNHSSTYVDSPLLGIEQKWVAYSRFFETVSDRPEGARWERDARRTLAKEARYAAGRVFVKGGDTGAAESQGLLDFAARLDPRRSAADDWAWQLRRRLGPKKARTFPLFLPRLLVGRLEWIASEKRRFRSGG